MQWIEANLAMLRQCKAMDLALVECMKAGGAMAHPPEQDEQLRVLVEAEEKAERAALVHRHTLTDCSCSVNCAGTFSESGLKSSSCPPPPTTMLGAGVMHALLPGGMSLVTVQADKDISGFFQIFGAGSKYGDLQKPAGPFTVDSLKQEPLLSELKRREGNTLFRH